jgi:hypothetical protein
MTEIVRVTPEELNEIERLATTPLKLQKSLVAKLAAYTDYIIAHDLKEFGIITDNTRKMIDLYNSLLVNMHKELYGEKQVSVGEVKVTHSMIMNEVRKHSKIIDAEFKEGDHDGTQ